MIELVDICKEYCLPTGQKGHTVLDRVSLSVGKGYSIAVAGPSGSGKSTLLNIMGALDRPDSGKVSIGGIDLSDLDDYSLSVVRNQDVGFVFQMHHLLPQLTVLENVIVPALAGNRKDRHEYYLQRAEMLLDRVGLKDRTGYRPGELSGGQMQRVAVVRALINQPKVLLADEPTGSLDKAGAADIADLLVELNESTKVTLVVVTHSQAVARRMGKIYRISESRLFEGQRD